MVQQQKRRPVMSDQPAKSTCSNCQLHSEGLTCILIALARHPTVEWSGFERSWNCLATPVCLRRVHSPATQHQWGNQNHPGKQSSNLASYPCMIFNILHLPLPNELALNAISTLNFSPSQCNPAGLRSRLHTLLPKQGSQMILPQESSSSIHKLTETPTL